MNEMYKGIDGTQKKKSNQVLSYHIVHTINYSLHIQFHICVRSYSLYFVSSQAQSRHTLLSIGTRTTFDQTSIAIILTHRPNNVLLPRLHAHLRPHANDPPATLSLGPDAAAQVCARPRRHDPCEREGGDGVSGLSR
jgi:hypothetical protein